MDEFISVCANGKPTSCLERFQWKTFENILVLQWKQIRKKDKPSDKNHWCFWLSPIKVTVSKVVIRFVYGSYYLLHLLSCFFSLTFKTILEKMILEKHQILTFFDYSIILLNPLAKIWSAMGASHIQLRWELPDSKPHVLALSTCQTVCLKSVLGFVGA